MSLLRGKLPEVNSAVHRCVDDSSVPQGRRLEHLPGCRTGGAEWRVIGNRSTHRMADGVRIPGTWRHAFMARQAGISLPG